MNKPLLIGMLHVPPLPGAPRFDGNLDGIHQWVLNDAKTLVENGIGQLLLENFGDVPFSAGPVGSHVVAHMTALACEVKRRFPVPLGINVLRNDACAAMAIAHAVDADFVRVNVLSGARVTDQGLIQGIAHELMRLRKQLGAEAIRVFADVNVKHSTPLADTPLEDEVADLIDRAGADGLIVTGSATGKSVCLDEASAVKASAGDVPVLIGSGVTAQSIGAFQDVADGFIVGTGLKRHGAVNQPVDPQRVQALVQACA